MARLKATKEIDYLLEDMNKKKTDRNIVMLAQDILKDSKEPGHIYHVDLWEQETGKSLQERNKELNRCKQILQTKTAQQYINDKGELDE